MKIKDILKNEEKNNGIILYKEGIFYRCYQCSAMRMVGKLKSLKVLVKKIKSLGVLVFYCGFPESVLPQVKILCEKKGYRFCRRNEKRVDIQMVSDPMENFEKWQEEVLSCLPISPKITPIVEKHYDLVKWLMPKLNKFPRDQRFLLADRIQNRLLEILEMLAVIIYQKDKQSTLVEVNAKLDCLRLMMRLAADLKYVNLRAYDYFSVKINEIGRMVGGWMKTCE